MHVFVNSPENFAQQNIHIRTYMCAIYGLDGTSNKNINIHQSTFTVTMVDLEFQQHAPSLKLTVRP